MTQPAALEERQRIDIAEREVVAHVEIGTRAIRGNVVSIDEKAIGSIRGIINGMAIRVGETQRQIADRALHADLKSVVNGVCLIPERRNSAVARECGAKQVRVRATSGNREVDRCLPGDRYTTRRHRISGYALCVKSCPTVRRDGGRGDRLTNCFANFVGVRGKGRGVELVGVVFQRQMCAFASHVCRR